MKKTIDVKVSECCLAEIIDGICIHCDHPCETVIAQEPYYDEIRADDERAEKE